MPTATFSRKASRKRQASSDIEEDRPTPSRDAEQVEEDNEAPKSRRANGVKKEKKPKITAKKELVPDADDDEDGDERIDVDSFRDQPLSQPEVTKLQGLARDWDMVAAQVRPTGGVVGDVAVALADYGEGEDVKQGLTELDKLMRDLIDITAEMQDHENVLKRLAEKIGQGEILARLFREVQYPGSAIPPIKDFIPEEDGDVSEDDDDLEMGGVSQNYNCPITLTLLVDPVTSCVACFLYSKSADIDLKLASSDVCKHSFSKAAIMQSFRSNEPTIKCPASGCTKRFGRSNLKPDKDLAKRVKAHDRRLKRAQQEDDAEEIID
ncbi:hypothetical protein H0H93_015531 [Arthromyces matolae]|nr:hypothetical protein H0H93_015531 [Arthromyces matolae]